MTQLIRVLIVNAIIVLNHCSCGRGYGSERVASLHIKQLCALSLM